MHLTVAICTWNRCDMLRQTLEQLTQLRVPAGVEWELLVVNNNSSDATDRVIDSFKERLPIQGLFEGKAGKSNALNLASNTAKGQYIIWTDDDVLVDPDWMIAYHRAFVRWPDAVVFGGAIEPWFEGTPPEWLRTLLPKVGNAYGVRNLGAEPMPLQPPEIMPFGANMAVRRDEQLRFMYDTSVGPRPNSNLRGEEIQLVARMLESGLTGWWVPDAKILHFIPAERQTVRHIRSYYSGWGEYVSLLDDTDHGEKLWFGRPRWAWRGLVEGELRYRVKRVLRRPEAWIDDLVAASIAHGQLRAYARRPLR